MSPRDHRSRAGDHRSRVLILKHKEWEHSTLSTRSPKRAQHTGQNNGHTAGLCALNYSLITVLDITHRGDSFKAWSHLRGCGLPTTATLAHGESPRARHLIALLCGITAWLVAYQGWSSEPEELVEAQAAIRAKPPPPFQSVRAGETPPCVHTTSRCPALGSARGGGGGGCVKSGQGPAFIGQGVALRAMPTQ